LTQVLFDPIRWNFFWSEVKKLNNLRFLGDIFQTQSKDGWPDPRNKKLTQTHHYPEGLKLRLTYPRFWESVPWLSSCLSLQINKNLLILHSVFRGRLFSYKSFNFTKIKTSSYFSQFSLGLILIKFGLTLGLKFKLNLWSIILPYEVYL